jgi:hypothetical protein
MAISFDQSQFLDYPENASPAREVMSGIARIADLKPDIARGPGCVPKLDKIIPPVQRLLARDSTFSCEPCSH